MRLNMDETKKRTYLNKWSCNFVGTNSYVKHHLKKHLLLFHFSGALFHFSFLCQGILFHFSGAYFGGIY